jgi:hypothetical protein
MKTVRKHHYLFYFLALAAIVGLDALITLLSGL